MQLFNCKKCGKVIEFNRYLLCEQCKKEEKEAFEIVREYLYHHKGANIVQVSDATGVDRASILRFLKEERIALSDDKSILRRCESCGVMIEIGSKCKDCITKELAKEMKVTTSGRGGRQMISDFGRRRRN